MIRDWAKRHMEGDRVIWFVVFALSALGILVVYSASGSLAYRLMEGNTEHYLFKHLALVMLSLGAMWVTHKIDYRYYSKFARLALWISIGLMLVTWKFGVSVNEATRWLYIPVINQSFQPADLAKLALIASLAAMLAKHQKDFKPALIPILLWCGAVCGIIAMTNFSTAALLFFTCLLVMFIGRMPFKYLLLYVLIGAMAGSLALFVGQRGKTVMSRVTSYWESSQTTLPDQSKYSNIAIATGGLVGKGWGQSEQRNFLPLAYSDFIYAIIIEEYGLAGGFVVLLLYLILLYRGMRAVQTSTYLFGSLLSAGLSFALILQAIVNMAVATGVIPITGLPLPLVSLGGSSLLFTGIAFGMILSVSKGERKEAEDISFNTPKDVVAA